MFPTFFRARTSLIRKGLSLLVFVAVCGLATVAAMPEENTSTRPSATHSSSAESRDMDLPKAGQKAVFSLLTADPGKQVWSHYGHTGIRYVDPETGTDVVFNYGLFDFSSPNFMARFVKGQTDYMVGTTSFFNFMLEYQLENRGVYEQVLNLTSIEKDRLLGALLTNIRPENRTYRYNFFFKNCSTMPRDLIEQAVEGKVTYSFEAPFGSLRDEIHHFTDVSPWTQFGIDLALGAPADKKASLRDQQFAPTVLMQSFATAHIENDSLTRPLVVSTVELNRMDPLAEEPVAWTPHPLLVFWVVCVLTLLLTLLQLLSPANNVLKGMAHVWDGLLYGAGGLVGCLMYFLLFASEHPTVDVNYLAIWLHPLHLLFAIYLLVLPLIKRIPSLKKGCHPSKKDAILLERMPSLYKAINLPFCVVALGGLLYFPQELHPALVPVLVSFLIRSIQGAVATINAYRHA
jgi:hypothetical protein